MKGEDGLKQEIRALEDSILEMEAQFSENQPVDVSLLLEKTRRLTELQVNLAKEEGLRAGLVIQDLKKQRRSTQETESVPSLPVLENTPIVEEKARVLPPVFKGNDGKFEDTRTESDIYYQTVAQDSADVSRFIEKFSELNLGKYVMAILAAILALAGTLLLGALMWENISNEMKAGFFALLATLMIFLPFRHIMGKESRQTNGFLTSLMGSGLSIHYINSIFMGTSWGLMGDDALLLSLIGLIFLTVFLSHHIQSNTLLIVSYIGNFLTYFLLILKEIPINQLFIAVILLLSSTLFLIAYTLKNEWTFGFTKLSSFVLGLLVLGRANEAVERGNYLLYRSIAEALDFV